MLRRLRLTDSIFHGLTRGASLAVLAWFLILSPRLSTAAKVADQATQMQGKAEDMAQAYEKALALDPDYDPRSEWAGRE